MLDTAAKLSESFSETLPEYTTAIEVTYFNSKKSNYFNIINNKGEPIKLNKQTYKLEFKLPTYIEQINIEFKPGIIFPNKPTLSLIDTKGNKREISPSSQDKGDFWFSPEDVASGFELDFSKFTTKPEIINVAVYGFRNHEFEIIAEKLTKAIKISESFRSEMAKATKEINTQNEKIDNKNAELEAKEAALDEELKTKSNTLQDIVSQIETLTEQRNMQQRKLEVALEKTKELEASAATASEKERSALQTESELREKISQQTTEKIALEKKLKELDENIHLFSDEIASFAEESNKHSNRYLSVSVIPMAVIVIITIELLTNSISVLGSTAKGENIFSIYLERLPFVFVCIALIHACYHISMAFIKRVMQIHQQRLSLSKISIIAKDVSDASCDALENISDSEKYELRTKLKMDLLKAHLKSEIGDDYEHPISRHLNSALTTIVNKFRKSEETSGTDTSNGQRSE